MSETLGDVQPREDERRGRRRLATVLVADIVGSTAAVEGLDVEDANDILYSGVSQIAAAIRDEGGVVVNMFGDGLLAVFGSEVAREDDTERSCKAALKIVDKFQTPFDIRGSQVRLSVRVGVHVGEVLLHRTFSDHGSWLNVSGFPVHVAAKIQQASEADTVSISLDAMSLLKGGLTTSSTQTISLHGMSANIHYCSLLSLSTEQQYQLAQQVVETPIIGRDEHLRNVANNLNPGRTSFTDHLFEGAAGVGKSRLVSEVLKTAQGREIPALLIKGEHSTRNTSYSSLWPALTSILQLRPPLNCDTLSSAMARAKIPKEHLKGLQEVLAVPGLDKAFEGSSSSVRYAAANTAIMAVIRHATESTAGCLLIIVEDVDNLDEFTFDVVSSFRTEFADDPVVLIATSRPDPRDRLAKINPQYSVLEPLDRLKSTQVVKEVLGEQSISAVDLDQILDQADGVPFMLRAFAQSYRRAHDGASVIPVDLAASTQLRLERLSPTALRLMLLLSISKDGLERAVCEPLFETENEDEDDLDTVASELVQSGLAKTGGERFVELHHALLGQACEGMMLRADKRELHGELLTALQSSSVAPLPFDRLAHHAEKAGDLDRALDYYWEACKREVRRSSLPAITALFERVERICREIGTAADPRFARFSLLTFDSFQQRGLLDGLLERMTRVAEISRASGNALHESQALTHCAMVDWLNAQHDVGFNKAEKARRLAQDHHIPPMAAYAQYMMASCKQGAGEIRTAIKLHSELIEHIGQHSELLQSLPIRNTVFVSHSLAVWCMAKSGEFERAQGILDQAHALAEGSTYPFGHVMLNAAQALLHYVRGDYVLAADYFDRCRKICQDDNVEAMEAFAVACLAQCRTRLGTPETAVTLLDDAYQRRIQFRCGKCCRVSMLVAQAEAYALLGETVVAIDTAEDALMLARAIAEPGSELLALLTKGDILFALTHHVERARKYYTAALNLAEKRGFVPAAHFARLGLARLANHVATSQDSARTLSDALSIAHADGLRPNRFSRNDVVAHFHDAV